ncbi:MAG: NGG1p interacting factor NIF3 [Oligoflexales bacterium]|nr:NGG1p interacting factor NIF3 [Oligoflexales bacterium]
MYQIYFYVPPNKLNSVLDPIFRAGRGYYGNYDQCCWITEGVGQFRPLQKSKPYLGKQGEATQTPELKVELICIEEKLSEVIAELKKHHPYEQPAYGVIKLEAT